MNKKKLIVLQEMAVAIAVLGSSLSEASETRWHIGVDVGMAQYKQERKQRKHPTYKEVLEMLDKESKALDDAKNLIANLKNTAVAQYHTDKVEEWVTEQSNNIDNAGSVDAVRTILIQAGVAPDAIANLSGFNNNNIIQARNSAKQTLNLTGGIFDKRRKGVTSDQMDFAIVDTYVTNLTNKVNALNLKKTELQNYMKKNSIEAGDLLRGDMLNKYDKEYLPSLKSLANTDLYGFMNRADIKWALNDEDLQDWMQNNWYGQGNNPADIDEYKGMFDKVSTIRDEFIVKLAMDKIARQETKKAHSGRITSPAVEANIGVTRQCGKGILGAELLVGVNCKEVGKKKKTDAYTQNKTPVYGAGIVRAGLIVADRVELYALGGVRFNKLAPIVGAGARFYSKTKSYFFKTEFQKTLGNKYPKGHVIKLGFGWTI